MATEKKSRASSVPKKTVLITGAGGALAKRVIAKLHPDYQIVAVDFRRKVETDTGIDSYKIEMEKRGFEDVFIRHKIDAVIHLGRIFAHEQSRMRRYNANVLGSKKLFDLCRKYGVKQLLVHSTYFVYGASPFNPALIDEGFPLKASEVTMDLVDSVELESLANIYLWKHPELNITILRPCNVLGPGVKNSMSLLLSQKFAPVLMGFSPIMQFLHVDDMAEATVLAFKGNKPGIYNVAPNDYIPYQKAVTESNCHKLHIPSIPPVVPNILSHVFSWKAFFPSYLINYFKYPVVLDGQLFANTFGFAPKRNLNDIFSHYRHIKRDRRK